MKIVEVPGTNRSNFTHVQNGTTFNIGFLVMNDYNQADLFGRFEQIKDLDILLYEFSPSYVISLRASFRMYGSDSSHDTLSVTRHC